MFLSIAMMVKDEAANLRRCLESVKPLKAELIIVDTGSTDATLEIASEYGAQIFIHPWQDDFALHRQQSFDYCKGDWILQIDADEELIFPPNSDLNRLRHFLTNLDPKYHQIGIAMQDMRDNGKRKSCDMKMVRVFRRGSVKWRYCVHNYPQTPNDTEAAACPFFYLKHYGYDLTPEQKIAKGKRTIPLLYKRLQQDKKDWNAYYYLMHAHAVYVDDTEKAIEYGNKYLSKIENIKKVTFNNTVFYTMFKLLQKHDKPKQAEEVLKQGLSRLPHDVDLTYGLMEYGLWTGDQRIITAGADRYLDSYKKFNSSESTSNVMHTFNYNRRSFALATYQLLLSRMQGTAFLYDQLKGALREIDPEYAAKTEGFLDSNSKALGIEICRPLPSSPAPASGPKPSNVIRRLFKRNQIQTASI